ncbi:unnamed protein product [Alopecurus aequalis]
MNDGGEFPTDVLAHILERLHPNARRRLRLVSQHRRHVVDTRTATSLRSRAKTLLITVERAYVLDNDDLSTGQRKWEMPVFRDRYGNRGTNEVVGVCNGIICMCDDHGGIHLYNANPMVGGTLSIPSLLLPRQSDARMWRRTFGFTHDMATGRYMVVHIQHDRVMVFTLGEAAWQEVIIIPYAKDISNCNKDGFVTVDGTIYWAMDGKGRGKVMSFDLDGKRAPSAIPLPSPKPAGTWRLTEVLGRLAIVFSTDVWVMERGASAEATDTRWSLWYSVHVQRLRHQPKWHDQQQLTWPHFAHGSKHIMTWEWLSTGGGCALYQHMASNHNTKARRGTVQINQRNQGTLVAHIETKYDTFMRFDYIDSTEQLRAYKCW